MKRAAVIKVYTLLSEDPAPYWHTDSDDLARLTDGTAEQLLADLRGILSAADYDARASDDVPLADAVARVRALLPGEGDEDE
jgi:hypothetical protein